MARPNTVENDQLIERLSRVFRTVGFEGATLAALAAASGLKKASLYHRFPGGKEQMASEVLAAAGAWLTENVLDPLRADEEPAKRLNHLCARLSSFYEEGQRSCLLNMLAASYAEQGPFDTAIKNMLEAFIAALAQVLMDAGMTPAKARTRSQFAVAQIHGSLVLCRGMNTTRPFKDCLAWIRNELIVG